MRQKLSGIRLTMSWQGLAMSKKIYIAKLSGGKDSTAMVDLLLRNNYPLDYILFCDTLAEFGAMYEYLDKLDAYFKKAYGKSITRTKPKKQGLKPHPASCNLPPICVVVSIIYTTF